ncbi:MAG: hypothetical protein COW00_09400 [Bdellovibrio sp. CG12_big_fil_rev_8_21_14_0_65_39_13]|nr:MAG: hypothetical protein COW78_09475 [Bdellovibrio sp. CG22_combo_CG10-13_8_21_14_all_39_27]PIQ59837.1 MAG: hypothetical protein COW00_09400 [Bdellovibrio sp. CG12_big_fil_rev_8_21_14_0_65_39_13]PIR36135.1 MAG: hypothetical protein COV37_03990 [Bdellovibrio sp. CG11_big_fil_rev_8_21_14_0_20_39_38]
MTEMLKEKEDFYYDDQGFMVFTESYLQKRGFCCQSGCRHCPWKFSEKFDPSYPLELQCQNTSGDVIDFDDEDDF